MKRCMIKYSLGNMKKGLGLGVSDVQDYTERIPCTTARYPAPLPTQPLLRVLSRSAYDIIFKLKYAVQLYRNRHFGILILDGINPFSGNQSSALSEDVCSWALRVVCGHIVISVPCDKSCIVCDT